MFFYPTFLGLSVYGLIIYKAGGSGQLRRATQNAEAASAAAWHWRNRPIIHTAVIPALALGDCRSRLCTAQIQGGIGIPSVRLPTSYYFGLGAFTGTGTGKDVGCVLSVSVGPHFHQR